MNDLTGQSFGSYRLERLLGRGGMSEVYRARHLRLTNRLAAVKVLPASLAQDPSFLQRFEHEANAAASLDHPSILPVWDYGEQDGVPYLAMPLVLTGSLKEYLEQSGPLSPAAAESFLAPIAAALDYAHSRGLLHRDVKPANILLREDRSPMLADFGIAKAIADVNQPGLTQAGSGIGTPEYMAPEQIEGRAGPRSDLYALGVTLYQMLSGRLPYDGATPYEVALKQLSNPLPPLRQFRPEVPPAIEAVVNKALAKDPAARYASGHELVDAYRAALAHPQSAVPTTVLGPPPQSTAVLPGLTPGEQARPPVPPPPVVPAVAPPPAGVPPERRSTVSWPLIAAAVLVAGLLLGGGAFALYQTLVQPTPTPTVIVNRAATQTMIAQQTAAAIPPTVTITPLPPTVTPDTAATAAVIAGATATVNFQTGATAAANATVAANATATAAGAANATGTANAAASVTARVVRSATVVALLTATAAAQPTATPTRAPTNTPVPPTNTPVPPTATPVPPTAPKPPPSTGAWGPTLAPLSGGKRVNDPNGRYSVSIPTTWGQIRTNGSDPVFGPPDNSANFTVTLDKVQGNTTIDGYNTAIETILKEQLAGYTSVSVEKVQIGKYQAYKRVSRGTVQGQPVQIMQVYFVDKNVAHVLSFGSTPDDFAGLSKAFDGIAGSYTPGN